jgi:hypothetical protein
LWHVSNVYNIPECAVHFVPYSRVPGHKSALRASSGRTVGDADLNLPTFA